MDKSVVQALSGLIPTLNGSLPTELVELATSLLIQSRSKARSLKADEEIARSYACSHLACERLKQSLGLPKIQARPPCSPKVYQKLYRFLDTTLLAGTRRSTRALAVNREELTLRSLPSKAKASVKVATFKQATPRTRASRPIIVANEVPEWVMPAIRLVCNKLGALSAPHHVFAGVSSILTLPPPNERKTNENPTNASKNISALIMVIFLIVYARLAAVKTPSDIFLKQKTTGFEILREYLGEEAAGKVESNDADFDRLIVEIKDRGWTEMDWFENVIPGTGLNPMNTVEEVEMGLNDEETTRGEIELAFQDNAGAERDFFQASSDSIMQKRTDYLSKKRQLHYQEFFQAGSGTMMQEKVDFLSEKRRRNYQEWKKGILLQIEELRQAEDMNLGAG